MKHFLALIVCFFALNVSASEAMLTLTCSRDTDCRFNEKCKYGRCVDKNSCSFDTDCDFNDICEFGRCRMPQCNGGPWDCPSGQRCDRGRCERDPFAKHCATNEDCPTYERCDMGYCR